MKGILGIDPGLSGAFALITGGGAGVFFECMPVRMEGKDKEIDFDRVQAVLSQMWALSEGQMHVILERAMPMAMGSKHAFNYGRGFAALELAIRVGKFPVTYVEPSKWSKALLAGVDLELRPKSRSAVAFKRLFPHLVDTIPMSKTGKIHEGFVDALLIAEFGRRMLGAA